MKRNKVILVRGIPGCGKSTQVFALREKYQKATGSGNDFTICSADHYFMVTGRYTFDPTRLGQAHAASLSSFVDAVQSGTKVIVVDNTFIHHWEMKNYLEVARLAGNYDVEIQEILVKTIDQLKACIRRNTHQVPGEIISRMAMEFDPMPGATIIPFGGK